MDDKSLVLYALGTIFSAAGVLLWVVGPPVARFYAWLETAISRRPAFRWLSGCLLGEDTTRVFVKGLGVAWIILGISVLVYAGIHRFA